VKDYKGDSLSDHKTRRSRSLIRASLNTLIANSTSASLIHIGGVIRKTDPNIPPFPKSKPASLQSSSRDIISSDLMGFWLF
jgi:hypothetical protein